MQTTKDPLDELVEDIERRIREARHERATKAAGAWKDRALRGLDAHIAALVELRDAHDRRMTEAAVRSGSLAKTVAREIADVSVREVTSDYGRGMKDGILEALLAIEGWLLRAKMGAAHHKDHDQRTGAGEARES